MLEEFLNNCELVYWYNVAVIEHSEVGRASMYVIAVEPGKTGKVLQRIYKFLGSNEELEAENWSAVEFQGKIILGRPGDQ